MAVEQPSSSAAVENYLAKVFDIVDSYDFARFSEVFAEDLDYEGGLVKASSLADFIKSIEKQKETIGSVTTSHSRFKNVITGDGTVYSHGHSKAVFAISPDNPVTVPMLGCYYFHKEGPEAGKIKGMYLYKDRLPFAQFVAAWKK